MKEQHQYTVSTTFGLVTVAAMIYLTTGFDPAAVDLLHWGIITAMILFTSSFGIQIAGGEVSLQPMINLTGILVLGPIPAGWAILTGSFLYGFGRHLFPDRTGWQKSLGTFALVGTTANNISMLTTTVLVSGWVYVQTGGLIPLASQPDLIATQALFALGASYLALNYSIASFFFLMRGKAHLTRYTKNLSSLLIYEIPPVVFAPLSAQIFLELGLLQFGMIAFSLVMVSLLLRWQARDQRDLQRRILELDSLQRVGQTLSASLDIDEIAGSIYTEVSRLMSARNFFLALYDKDADEVSFPVAYEHNQLVDWQPRATRNGLTEHVLKTGKPLLITENVREKIDELDAESIGREALSWLGVPIMAGENAMGVIAVQSYPRPGHLSQVYDESHLEILKTIATQASVAIRNAGLYTQTDKTLARRVQELDSILRTTREGLLLVDSELYILTANRALAEFLAMPLVALKETYLPRNSRETPTIFEKIGFTPEALENTLNDLRAGKTTIARETIYLGGNLDRPLERVVTPVLDAEKNVSGWLFVFRDLTEEYQLGQLRDDMTRMLVHDLRAPIVTISSGLDMIETDLQVGEDEEILEMVKIAKRGTDRMLELTSELLNISKLESGKMPIELDEIDVAEIYWDTSERFAFYASQINIQFTVEMESNFPAIPADPELIGRVIYNLIDNAIKFSPDDSQIKLWAKRDASDASFVLLGVSDQGSGIPKEDQEVLFQKYSSGHEGLTRRKGTGLGLYFTRLAVEAHGGQVWIDAKAKRGCTVVMRLPVVKRPK